MEKNNILGINIHKIKKLRVQEKINEYLNSNRFHYIVTPNPEIILAAGKDEEYFFILNHADFAIPDGVGLWFAGLNLGVNFHRYPGADLVKDILASQEKRLNIIIFNWQEGLSSRNELEMFLKEKYSHHDFLVIDTDKQGRRVDWQNVKNFNPQLVLVTLGAPHQEKFIHRQIRKNLPSVLAIGIGGALDFLTGKIVRAPKILRAVGLEWLWRVFNQPKGKRLWRLKRIFIATIKFPIKFLKWRYVLPFFYRSNVACLVYKKSGDKYKVLLVERADEKGHWQILQGGTDGLSLKEAGLKEAQEELGTERIKTIATFKNLHHYKFPDESPRHRGAEYRKHTGYKGQKQGLFIGEFFGQDEEIKIEYWDHTGWQWADADRVLDIVHPLRREATKKYLNKFNSLDKK